MTDPSARADPAGDTEAAHFFLVEFDVPNAKQPYYRRFRHPDPDASKDDLLLRWFKLVDQFDQTNPRWSYFQCDDGRAVRKDAVLGFQITGPHSSLPAHLDPPPTGRGLSTFS